MSELWIVPTPIGNLADLTFRAKEVLESVDIILAEDKRQTSKLLNHYGIRNHLLAYHQHNENKISVDLLKRILAGETMAIVTDGGTPLISDPGFPLVRECIKNNVEVHCLPGATAFTTAIAISGLPVNRFCFEGFLAHKKGRNKRLASLANETRTMVFYESPHRISKTLKEMISTFGSERRASVSRELTKIYEETKRGTLEELSEYFNDNAPKGEFVIVVSGKE